MRLSVEAGRADPITPQLALLRLLHLADSALPIGAVPHSFGLESLVDAGLLTPPVVYKFLAAYLEEAGVLDAVFCRAAFLLGGEHEFCRARWVQINDRLSAMKPARESRVASSGLGARLLALVLGIIESPRVRDAIETSHEAHIVIHHSAAFGFAGGVLGIGLEETVNAFLHQSITSLVSACQRLMPLGQTEATRMIWDLKPAMLVTVDRSRQFTPETVPCFLPLLDWGAMEHPALTTRLFIS